MEDNRRCAGNDIETTLAALTSEHVRGPGAGSGFAKQCRYDRVAPAGLHMRHRPLRSIAGCGNMCHGLTQFDVNRSSSRHAQTSGPGSNLVIAGGDVRRLRSQILLVNIAIRADDERHNATRPENRWPGNQCRAAGHAARLDVTFGPAVPIGALRLEDAEMVAFIRNRLTAD
jgi:hypothetical protein